MRRRMLVSVIIPTYNYGHFLGEALESVMRQTYGDWEIIVVDDGSTDHTPNVVETYRARLGPDRFNAVRTANAGISSARNTGLGLARGEYIAFLDADDRWLPEKLERQVRIMEAEPTVCAIFTNFVRFNAEKVFADDQFTYFPELAKTPTVATRAGSGRRVATNAFIEFMRFGEFPAWVQTTMLRASMVNDLDFADAQDSSGHLFFLEDSHYCFRAFRRGDVAFIRDHLVEVRRHDTNITKRTRDLGERRREIARQKLETLRQIARCDDLSVAERAAVRKRMARALIGIGTIHANQGDRKSAVTFYIDAIRSGAYVRGLIRLASVPVMAFRRRSRQELTSAERREVF